MAAIIPLLIRRPARKPVMPMVMVSSKNCPTFIWTFACSIRPASFSDTGILNSILFRAGISLSSSSLRTPGIFRLPGCLVSIIASLLFITFLVDSLNPTAIRYREIMLVTIVRNVSITIAAMLI